MQSTIEKIIPGTYGKYKVDLNSDVWSKKKNGWKKLKQHKRRQYLKVTLSVDNVKHQVQVHRLVAEAFIPNPNNLPEVNHKDENPLNNRFDNLEWCTSEYNRNYGTRLKRIRESQLNDPTKSNTVDVFTSSGVFVANFPSESEAARYLNVYTSRVSDCCNGRTKALRNGYICRFANPNSIK